MGELPLGPWERHAEQQRRRWLTLSHAQRLAWLTQAKLFCSKALGATGLRNVVAGPPNRSAQEPSGLVKPSPQSPEIDP